MHRQPCTASCSRCVSEYSWRHRHRHWLGCPGNTQSPRPCGSHAASLPRDGSPNVQASVDADAWCGALSTARRETSRLALVVPVRYARRRRRWRVLRGRTSSRRDRRTPLADGGRRTADRSVRSPHAASTGRRAASPHTRLCPSVAALTTTASSRRRAAGSSRLEARNRREAGTPCASHMDVGFACSRASIGRYRRCTRHEAKQKDA